MRDKHVFLFPSCIHLPRYWQITVYVCMMLLVSASSEEDFSRASYCMFESWCTNGRPVVSGLLLHWCSGIYSNSTLPLSSSECGSFCRIHKAYPLVPFFVSPVFPVCTVCFYLLYVFPWWTCILLESCIVYCCQYLQEAAIWCIRVRHGSGTIAH